MYIDWGIFYLDLNICMILCCTLGLFRKMNEQQSDDIDGTKVDIAVRFLSNSNVKDTEKEQQEKFLRNKGLSPVEIDLAYQRVLEIEANEIDDDGWSIFDYLKAIVLGAGVLSAANYAYKAYILPYATRELKDDARMEGLIESFQVVKDDIKQHTYELTGTLKQMQVLMEENQKSLISINSELKKDTTDVSSVSELKSELSMIKSMMLNKTQFPATPYAAVNQKVNEIPAWQRIAEEFNADETTEEPDVNKMTKDVIGCSEVCNNEIPAKPSVLVNEELSASIPLESNIELAIVVNDEPNVDPQIPTDNPTHTIVIEQHRTEITKKDPSSHFEVQYSKFDVSQVSLENVNEEQPLSKVEQSFINCIDHEHVAEVPITTEVNGILYEVVPNVEQLPSTVNDETFSSEIFIEGTDVLKSEYNLSHSEISEVDTNDVEEENPTGMKTDIEKDSILSEIQVEIAPVILSDDIIGKN